MVITGTGLMTKETIGGVQYIGVLDKGSITTSGDVVIEPGVTDVSFGSAGAIYLKPGFHAKEGCYFEAIVDPNIDIPVRYDPIVDVPTFDVGGGIYPGGSVSISTHATDADGDLSVHEIQVKASEGDWVAVAIWQLGTGADSQRTASITFPAAGVYVLRTAAKDSVSDWIYSSEVQISIGSHLPVPSAPQYDTSITYYPNSSITLTGQATDQDGDFKAFTVQIKKDGETTWYNIGGTPTVSGTTISLTNTIPLWGIGHYSLRTGVQDALSDWIYSSEASLNVTSHPPTAAAPRFPYPPYGTTTVLTLTAPFGALSITAHVTDEDGDLSDVIIQMRKGYWGSDWVDIGGSLSGTTSDATRTVSYTFNSDGYFYFRTAAKDAVNNWVYSSPESYVYVKSGAAPVITAQPASSKTVSQGQSFTLSVTASGYFLTYQWSWNGIPLQGATSNSYTRSNVTGLDAGTYTVRVENNAGYVVSRNAVVQVK
jgi:hypothetical protein